MPFRARPSQSGLPFVLKIGCEDNRPTCRMVSIFGRKRKRFAVSKEQNMAVYGMYDPL